MARLTPGYSFSTNETVTPTKFHNLIDAAYIIDLVTADLASGFKLPFITTPGSPANGDVRVGSDGLLEFFFGAAWNDHEPNERTLTLTNKSGSDLVTGDVVVPDPTNADSFTIAAIADPHIIGVLAANIANNASGLVYIRGVVDVRVLHTGAPVNVAGSPLRGPDGTFGSATVEKVAATPSIAMRSSAFGLMLEDISVALGSTELIRCFIWK